MPGEKGAWDLSEIAKWRLARVPHRKAAAAGDGSDDDSKTALECEKLRIDNEHRALKLAKARGALVERDAVAVAISQMFHRVRSRLEALPDELASSWPPEIRADSLADSREKVALALKDLEESML